MKAGPPVTKSAGKGSLKRCEVDMDANHNWQPIRVAFWKTPIKQPDPPDQIWGWEYMEDLELWCNQCGTTKIETVRWDKSQDEPPAWFPNQGPPPGAQPQQRIMVPHPVIRPG